MESISFADGKLDNAISDMQETNDSLLERARQFATAAHERVGQLRKYTGQPYAEHLRRVADIVSAVSGDAEMLAAAWLHDVVEDTPTTIEEIERQFGTGVRDLVEALTDISRPHDGNRGARKALDRAHLAQASARAQTVKLADLIDNCQDICAHNARFGAVFLGEMGALLDVLHAGDPVLLNRARKLHAKWAGRLKSPAEGVNGEVDEVPLPATLHRAIRLCSRAFSARDVAVPLKVLGVAPPPLTDGDCPRLWVVREATGRFAYALAASGPAPATPRTIQHTQWIDGDATLVEVVLALSRHDYAFVREADLPIGYVGRAELQGPVGRMWLFGMITSIELALTERIRSLCADQDWQARLTPARLEKAHALRNARAALGRPVDLLDCLQLSDKVRVLQAVDDHPRALLQGQSKAESQRLVRDLEDLRNSLAHSQDVVTHDWTQIARLARRVVELARA